MPHSNIAKIYKASDLFIHPALREGFGKVYLEATAARIPVVCHDSVHTQSLVARDLSRVNMENGTLVQACILELQSNLPLCDEIARRNYSHVVSHFEWENLKLKYLDMFQGALT